MTNPLDFYGSILSFAGGVVLTWDTLQIKKRITREAGTRLLVTALHRAGNPSVFEDVKGRPITELRDFQLWLARTSLRYGWIGFILLSAGFLLGIVAKL